jgi:hypothetical protein
MHAFVLEPFQSYSSSQVEKVHVAVQTRLLASLALSCRRWESAFTVFVLPVVLTQLRFTTDYE